jgi:hypothetical protein
MTAGDSARELFGWSNVSSPHATTGVKDESISPASNSFGPSAVQRWQDSTNMGLFDDSDGQYQPARPFSYPYAHGPNSFSTYYAPPPYSNNLQRPVSYPDAIPDYHRNPHGQSAVNDAGVLPPITEGTGFPSYPPEPQYAPLAQAPESSFRATKPEPLLDETKQEEDDDDQEEHHEQESDSTPQPRSRRKYAPPGPPVKSFRGYPTDDVDPPPNLSLYEVCQQYPASLKHKNLHDFLQRRWSVEEIYACLPDDVKDSLERRGFEQKTNYLYKRVQKEEKKLKPTAKGADGRIKKDVTLYLDLLNAPKRREDGRPSLLRTLTSRQSPHEHWRVRHGIGVDPATGLFVELPDDPNKNAPDLLRAVPADLRDSTHFVDNPPGQSNAGQASLRPRSHNSRKHESAGNSTSLSQSEIESALTNNSNDRLQNTTIPYAAPTSVTAQAGGRRVILPRHEPTPTPAQEIEARGRQTIHLPPTVVSNFSDSREPTLASMFPGGMIDLRGAYVRTISPKGTAIWHGTPSPEFVEAYLRDNKYRFWLDINLPRPNTTNVSYPPSIPAGASPGWYGYEPMLDTEVPIDWVMDAYERSAHQANHQADHRAVDAINKRKVEITGGQSGNEVDQQVKRARMGKKAATEPDLQPELQQAIFQSIESGMGEMREDGGVREGEDNSGVTDRMDTETEEGSATVEYAQDFRRISRRTTLSGNGFDAEAGLPLVNKSEGRDVGRNHTMDLEVDEAEDAIAKLTSEGTWYGLSSPPKG